MSKSKSIKEGYMTVGEVAKKMGVTIRALQYYDREGLFSPSELSEGGRRLYSNKDIVKLHQFLSMKSLGFANLQIKNCLNNIDTPEEIAVMLTNQMKSIQYEIDALTESLKNIELLKAEVLQMQKVDYKKYADIIVNLQMKNDSYRLIKFFDDDLLDGIRNKFDKESGLAFLNEFESLRIKAVQFHGKGITPDSESGQRLAEEIWELILSFTGGDMLLLEKLIKLGEIENDDDAWTEKQKIFNAYMKNALEIHLKDKIIPSEVK